MAGVLAETERLQAEEYKNKGNECYKQGLYDEAIVWYTKGINVDSNNALLYNNRSINLDSQNVKSLLRCVKCCITLGDLNEAKRLCTMIKQLEPANTELSSLLNRFEEALKDCDAAVSLEPNYVKARIRRAKCYSSLDEYEKAIEEWTAVVKLDGSSENKKSLQAAKAALSRSQQRDYYKILGLKKNASFDEIKQAYKKSALLYHPGTNFHLT
ncbi:unnamed protein product [Trichobilharzia regenti]|nr:unnamed protein product [Trichobilharzia regenti]